MESPTTPPKRVTRARAAAKAAKVEPKIKIATASSRAKAATLSTTVDQVSTLPATRGRTRAALVHKDEIVEEGQPKTRAVRGRSRKATLAEVAQQAAQDMLDENNGDDKVVVAVPMKRGRAKKADAPSISVQQTTRGRARKIEAKASETKVAEPAVKVTRGRAVSSTAAAATATKKTVSFAGAQNEKENVPMPTVNGKEKEVATGIKARPIRKAAIPSRATRSNPAPKSPQRTSPLSPKKITQIASPTKEAQDDFEDELADAGNADNRPSNKSSLKQSPAKQLDFTTSIIANRVGLPDRQNLGTSLLASPARRLPSGELKLKGLTPKQPSAATGNHLFKSPLRPDLTGVKSAGSQLQPSLKKSLLASPARKTGSPTKGDRLGSLTNLNFGTTPFKNSLQSPARRAPISPAKVSQTGSPNKSDMRSELVVATPRPTTFSLSRLGATPRTLNKDAFRPGKVAGSAPRPATVGKKAGPGARLFPGRLSAVMPRIADPVETANSVEEVMEDDIFENSGSPPSSEVGCTSQGIPDTTNIIRTPRHSARYGLRRDQLESLNDSAAESDSEDEIASDSPMYSPVPLPSFTTPNNNKHRRATRDLGFTPLAQQLSEWMGASPDKGSDAGSAHSSPSIKSPTASTAPEGPVEAAEDDAFDRIEDVHRSSTPSMPAVSTLFEDEMELREAEIREDDGLQELSHANYNMSDEETEDDEVNALTFAPRGLDSEDIELAIEAEEMSMLDFEAGDADEAVIHEEEEIADDPLGLYAAIDDAIEQRRPQQETLLHGESATGLPDVTINEVAHEIEEEPVRDLSSIDQEADAEAIDLIMPQETASPRLDEQETVTDVACAAHGDPDQSFDIAVSEASQEYGDENCAAVEALSASVTMPQQIQHTPTHAWQGERVLHTISKVPLKAAADDSPVLIKQRAQTALRPVPQRDAPRAPRTITPSRRRIAVASAAIISTPESCSTATKAPQMPDVSSVDVLNGAVVFVDVHTTEGADASAVFVELLTSMGARCVKTWSWNPNATPSPGSTEISPNNRVGITHVVFKDGGKRTLEKVRAAGGVVSCVGVGWVLDCERNSQWVDEAQYEINVSLVPRGGRNRRRSMEPRPLVQEGTPRSVSYSASTPSKSPGTSKGRKSTGGYDRRRSTQWVRSPLSYSSSASDSACPEIQSVGEDTMILSPVPRTPAAEDIAAYAEHILDDEMLEETPYAAKHRALVQMTMPVERYMPEGVTDDATGEIGAGGMLMQRLLLARRKSLQWAPKVGSPLKRHGTSSP